MVVFHGKLLNNQMVAFMGEYTVTIVNGFTNLQLGGGPDLVPYHLRLGI